MAWKSPRSGCAVTGQVVTRMVAVVLALGLGGLGLLVPSPVAADQSPAGCSQNNLTVDIGKSRTVVRNGDTVSYTVSVSNLDSAQGAACDLTGAQVVFIAPAADGTPTGARTVLATNVDYPAGTTMTVLGTIPYVVAANPGVSDTVAEAMATGVLHDAPVNDSADVVKTLGTTVTQPHTTLSASVTVTNSSLKAQAQNVAQYTYTETNNSSTPDGLSGVTVTDDACAPVKLVSGGANGGTVLGPGQTWTFTCSRVLPRPGVYVDHVQAGGIDRADGLPAPPESAVVSATVAEVLAEALPVTGPSVPPVPVGGLGLALLGLGLALCGVSRRRPGESRRHG